MGRPGDLPGAGSGAEGERTIVIEDEALRRGFTQLPNYLFQVRGLSHSAKLTYALILSYAWQKDYCFPGQETLARDLEVSTRSVIEYLKELQAHGLIRIQRRGLGLTNVYHVLRYPPAPDGPAPSSRQDTPPSPQEVKPSSLQGLKQATHPELHGASAPDLHSHAAPDVRGASHDKDAAPAKRGIHQENEQQHARAVVAPAGHIKAQQKITPRSADGASVQDSTTDLTRAAIAALQAHGVRGKRVLAELVADPTEVLAQVERLRQEMERGGVANPAGWLVEAIRGHYGVEGDEPPARSWADEMEPALDATPAATPDAGTGSAGPESCASSAAAAWSAVCAEVRAEVTPENYRRWFASTTAVAYSGQRLTIGVPDPFHLQWLDRRLRGVVERAAARALGEVAIVFAAAGRASA